MKIYPDVTLEQAQRRIKKRATDRHVLFGPVSFDDRTWFFITVTAGKGWFFAEQMRAASQGEAHWLRRALMMALVTSPPKKALVIQDFDDDLALAKMIEVLWPSEKARQLRERIERGVMSA